MIIFVSFNNQNTNTMRTIEFKAKRLDNGEWVFGSLIGSNRPFIIGSHLLVNDFDYLSPCVIIYNAWRKIIEMAATDIWEVDPETICQFTGLTDKNGNKIWEGDVLTNDIVNLQVVFRQGAFTVTHRKGDYAPIGWGIEQVNYRYEN